MSKFDDRLLTIRARLVETDGRYGLLWSTRLGKDAIILIDDDEDQALVFTFRPYRDSHRCVAVEVQGFYGDQQIVRQHFRSFNGRKAVIPLRPSVLRKFVKLVGEAQRTTPDGEAITIICRGCHKTTKIPFPYAEDSTIYVSVYPRCFER